MPNSRQLDPDMRGGLVLVSCTKAKLATPAPSRDLYCSPAFKLKRLIAERDAARWIILSAAHGIVQPDQVIAPYDETLTSLGVADRKAWADRVLSELLAISRGFNRVICLAGQRYAEFLVPSLMAEGIRVSMPLKGLRQGEQLSWLKKHQ